MGVFDQIKNYVTGGAAEIEVVIDQPILRDEESLHLLIKIRPSGETIHAQRLYVQVFALERSSTTSTLYKEEYVLEKQIQINEGETREWSYSLPIPADAPSTLIGKHFSVEWGVRANLDMSGLDPTSGWKQFVVNKAMDFVSRT